MTQQEVLEVLAAFRSDQIVVTSMSTVGIWPRFSDSPLDFAYLPSSMGQAPALGLGLALAQPRRGVIVLSGDGSLLMNLGCLVTIANHPANLVLVVMDNGLYEVTGGQTTAGSGRTDFAAIARGAGIQHVYHCADLTQWRGTAPEALRESGPVVVVLTVEGRLGQRTPQPPRPMPEQLERLRQALSI